MQAKTDYLINNSLFPLTTKVLSYNDNEEFNVSVSKQDISLDKNGLYFTATLCLNNMRPLGFIRYEVRKKDIYVHWVQNNSSYRHVGTALYEFVFRESFAFGKGGHVELLAPDNHHIFHYKCGFKAPIVRKFYFGAGAPDELKTLCEKYLNSTNHEEKNSIKEMIQTNHSFYYELAIKAASKSILKSVDKIEFDEVINKGMYCYVDANKEIQKLIDQSPGKIIDTKKLGSIRSMYLPDETIAYKKKLFNILENFSDKQNSHHPVLSLKQSDVVERDQKQTTSINVNQMSFWRQNLGTKAIVATLAVGVGTLLYTMNKS